MDTVLDDAKLCSSVQQTAVTACLDASTGSVVYLSMKVILRVGGLELRGFTLVCLQVLDHTSTHSHSDAMMIWQL